MLEKRGRKQGFFFGKVWSALMTFLLIVTTCVSAGMPVYAGDEDYDVEATGKLTDGGKTANVVVSLTNHGDNFGGYLRLCVSDRYGHNDYLNGYECYVAVAEEETDTVTISFPVIEGMDLENAKFELQILNEKKTPLQYEKLYHLFDADASAHIGILCDDPSALDYLVNYNSSGYGYYSYSGNDRKWESQALMPSELTDEITLTTISMIVIDDYDVSSLKKEEITAIEEWVKEGGILVIGTGENGDETFDAFDPQMMEASLASRMPYDDYSYYASSGYIAFSDINYGSSYVQNMARDARMKTVGRGGIVLAQFALTDPDLDRPYFAGDLFNTTSSFFSTANIKNYVFTERELEKVFGVMQGQAKLNAGLLTAIVVIYVILVGPILYLVLKKFDKREKIWYAVPIMSFVFVLLVFIASRGFSVRNRMFETIRVAKADGTGQEADYIFGFSASQKPWTVTLDDEMTTAGPIVLQDNYLDSGAEDQFHCLTSRSTKGVQIQYRPTQVFEAAYFKSRRPNPDEYGALEYELELKRSGITGTINNDTEYDFDYVLVVCDGYYQIIPDLESGDQYTLSGYGRNSYSNAGDLAAYARKLYDQEDYRSAKLMAALTMAAHELQGEGSFVVGITTSKEKILQGVGNSEESFLCVYAAK